MSAPVIQIVDDDDRDRASLEELVRSLGHQCVAYDDPQRFLDSIDATQPGCVLLDICMPGLTGIEVFEKLRAKGILLPVIVLSAFADIRMAVRALNGGAFGFLEKPYAAHEIVELINRALDDDLKSRESIDYFEDLKARIDLLTEREMEIVRAILASESNKQIAAKLGISVRTVEAHRASVMDKLSLDSVVELVKTMLDYDSLRTGLPTHETGER